MSPEARFRAFLARWYPDTRFVVYTNANGTKYVAPRQRTFRELEEIF